MLPTLRVFLAALRGTRPNAGARSPHRRRVVPRLEGLADRTTPATFTVTTALDAVNPADGKLSLREAITKANATPGADVIVLPAGTFRIALPGAEDANAAGDFDVTDSTLIQGAGAGATVVDARRLDRAFDVLGTAPGSISVTFQGLTVRNGLAATGSGGGIRVGNADLTVRGCAITGNRSVGWGGGISNIALPGTGNVTLVRSLVNRNVADGDGGGVSVLGNGQGQGSVLSVLGSTVRRNLAGNAAGIRATEVSLTNSTVSANTTLNSGGGLWADTATLTNTAVTGNSAANSGGGLLATAATLTNSTVSGNRAVDAGGGIAAGDVMAINSTVRGNTVAGEGGGIAAATATLIGSTVGDNFAVNGGGINAVTGTLTNSTVSGNSALSDGGGIRATTALLTNCTVSGNSATLQGGGLLATNVTLLNVTVTENSAREGGGVFLRANGSSSVRNTIIADNLADSVGGPDLSGAFTSAGHNLIGDGTGATGFVGGANGDQVGTAADPIDPRLGPLAFNGGRTQTHALLAGSPAVDRGDDAAAPAADQRGVARPRDGDGNGSGVADVGAVER